MVIHLSGVHEMGQDGAEALAFANAQYEEIQVAAPKGRPNRRKSRKSQKSPKEPAPKETERVSIVDQQCSKKGCRVPLGCRDAIIKHLTSIAHNMEKDEAEEFAEANTDYDIIEETLWVRGSLTQSKDSRLFSTALWRAAAKLFGV